ncbi:hypothetical protein [Streptomyces sp. NPDC055189]
MLHTRSKDRVVLLGDSGYCVAPTWGCGTSQALIGAYALAGELARARGNHTAAFTSYEHAMRPFVTDHQAVGRQGTQRFSCLPPLRRCWTYSLPLPRSTPARE